MLAAKIYERFHIAIKKERKVKKRLQGKKQIRYNYTLTTINLVTSVCILALQIEKRLKLKTIMGQNITVPFKAQLVYYKD